MNSRNKINWHNVKETKQNKEEEEKLKKKERNTEFQKQRNK